LVLEKSVSAVSDARVREALQGKPPAIVEEVTRINALARDRAIGLAMAAVGLFGLLGLLAGTLNQCRPTAAVVGTSKFGTAVAFHGARRENS